MTQANPFSVHIDPDQVRAAGEKLRESCPHDRHAVLPDRTGADPVAITERTNAERLTDLAAVRVGRMISSPFAFLRGSAALMAADLATAPKTGVDVQICGDAHAANFGLYASPERRLVFDLNDFDETVRGPWEWDLRRLATSLVVAGREAGADDDACRKAARHAARTYRAAVHEIATLPTMDGWYVTNDETTLGHFDLDDLEDTFERVSKKARKNTSHRAATKFAQRPRTDQFHFVEDPPILRRVHGEERDGILGGLGTYAAGLGPELRFLLGRFAVADVAFRVSGLGSVGNRGYVVLLHGNGGDDDVLILQVKEARTSALAPWTDPGPYDHQGERIIRGQRWMQTVNDILLGWTTIDDRPYLVRQFRDMKGSVDPALLKAHQLDDYARITGAVLGRAHCMSVDAKLLHAYLGAGKDGDAFDKATETFAVAYADRTEADHEALATAAKNGRIAATTGV
ncbi:DUF2252 domain-containing protein [Fodinicola acaciae]|uniref:DUF2252 domain-containing protein n=1 Tax=Fodinicola acaciae TaxID=2681555 RepID=UPI001C9E92F5|nr:DUF2252 domain-containing protein [Fodinicola acaciae]